MDRATRRQSEMQARRETMHNRSAHIAKIAGGGESPEITGEIGAPRQFFGVRGCIEPGGGEKWGLKSSELLGDFEVLCRPRLRDDRIET